jgi:uncharacterized protein
MSSATSPRVTVRRSPKRAHYDQQSIRRVLDRGRIAHISFCVEGQPYCIPTLYARSGDELLIHGSSASRMMRLLASGTPTCVTVTILDGLVLARSAFEHSANYDSVVILGSFLPITGESERITALERFVDALIPGRWAEVRAPNRKELNATMILALPIKEASVKTRTGPPDDDGSADARGDVWAGVIPLLSGYGQPQPSPGLRPGIPASRSVEQLTARVARPIQHRHLPQLPDVRPPSGCLLRQPTADHHGAVRPRSELTPEG